MNAYSDELRLLVVVVLNAVLLAAAYRLARRRGEGGAVQVACDALLFYFLVQYAAVALPGVCGVFNAMTMGVVAVVGAMGMWALAGGAGAGVGARGDFAAQPGSPIAGGSAMLPGRKTAKPQAIRRPDRLSQRVLEPGAGGWDADRLFLLACALFAAAYLLGYAYIERFVPPIATDPLVYHLPTAVQWMQTGKLGIYPTWYWNPAASYSPATSSTFMAWWMAPAGNEVFVRFVQLPPLMLIFFLVVRLCRLLGCGRTVAGLIAVAATLSRPLFSEAIFQKDDLYVTAFVLAAVVALGRQPLRDRLGPWRVGIAVGFVLASKYTVLLVCPIFLFLIDAPFRAGWKWRHFVIAIAIVLAMAAPWYVRNALLTGNPLFPVDVHVAGLRLQGLFGTERDRQLREPGGIWRMLSRTYFSPPVALMIPLALGWLWALWSGRRVILRDPLARACVAGSVVTLLIFLVTSPHHELRYIFPLIAMWFAAVGLGVARLPVHLAIAAALLLAAISSVTSFSASLFSCAAQLSGTGLAAAVIGVGLVMLFHRIRLRKPQLGLICGVAVLLLAMGVFVYWHAYVESCHQLRLAAWGEPGGYPREAATWKYVDEQVPADATIAYANSFYVYPYYGFNYARHVGYAPVRRGLHDFLHFPRMGDKVPGDTIVETMTAVMDSDPDRATWLQNLRTLGARYLIVAKQAIDPQPPELKLAHDDPARFIKLYEDDYGIVYQIEGK